MNEFVDGLETNEGSVADDQSVGTVDLFAEDLDLEALNSNDEATIEEAEEEVPAKEDGNDAVVTEPAEADIPEHLRNKSAAEYVEMIRNLESIKGTQGNELGTLRSQVTELQKFADTYLNRQLNSEEAPAPAAPVEEEIDFYSNPQEAINRAIANSDLAKQMQQRQIQEAQAQARAQANALCPDFETVQAAPEFAQWLQGNPAMMQAAIVADQKNDAAAAANLANAFKQMTGYGVEAPKVEEAVASKREESVQAVKGAAPRTGRKPPVQFKQSELRQLAKVNPTRYQAMSAIIDKAYIEGRVIKD